MNDIILVDENDNQVGVGEKLEVHRQGRLHRAFSIFVFSSKGELMLQLRATSKYHCGGLWTNTCCSHPRPGETLENAAKRRLKEEMGFNCELKEIFDYIYRVECSNGLIEHEFLHVFKGFYDGEPKVSPEEADGWKWMPLSAVRADVKKHPENYTSWFKLSLERI